jgi:hypothetical protein
MKKYKIVYKGLVQENNLIFFFFDRYWREYGIKTNWR